MKIFLLYGDMYACSGLADLKFAETGGHVIARECFSPGNLPEMYDRVECLVKPENGRTLRFEGCVREINGKGDVHISVHSKLNTENIAHTIEKITAIKP